MKEGNLRILLTQDEENRIERINNLREEEPPASSSHPHSLS